MPLVRTVLGALGLAALITPALSPMPALAAPVEVEAKLGQSLILAEKPGRVYLRLSLKALAARPAERRTSLNVALVLDRSGSMQGDRIVAAKDAATMALSRMSADDTVALVAFNHNVDVLQPATRLGASFADLKADIEEFRADGTTAIYAGVVEGGREARRFYSPDKVNRVILMSDGLANVGPATPKELGDLGRELASQGVTVSTIGLGLDYNEDLMQRLAAASDGNHAFVERPSDLVEIFNREFGDALSIAAQDITITIECRAGWRPLRLLGREGEISGNKITLKLAQLQEKNERYIVVELEPASGHGTGDADIADVSVGYLDLATKARAESKAQVRARYSSSTTEIEASTDKGVMAQVTAQIATEENEKAVLLRDKGDVDGAKKALEDNAAYLKRSKEAYASGASPAAPPALDALSDLERKNSEAASNLGEENWGKTRKGMRSDQHKTKVQQSY